MAGEVRVPVFVALKDDATAKLQTQLSGLSKSVKGFGSIVGKTIGTIGSLGAAVGAANFIGNSIDQAKNLERSLLSVQTVFGSYAKDIEDFSKTAVNFGMSQSESAKASVFLGSVLKQSGFAMGETVGLTKQLVKLGADLAATYGYDVQEALLGMTALFRGEYDPIEKFGVAMKQSEINSELAARGLDGLTGAARQLAEQEIRVELLMQRSADAMNAVERGSGTLYIETEKLRASFENLQANLGAQLVPVLAELFEKLRPIIEQSGPALAKVFTFVADVIAMLSDVMVKLFDPTTSLGKAFVEFTIALESLTTTITDSKNGMSGFGSILETVLTVIFKALAAVTNAIEDLVIIIKVLVSFASMLVTDFKRASRIDWIKQIESQIAIKNAIKGSREETVLFNAEIGKTKSIMDKARDAWARSWQMRDPNYVPPKGGSGSGVVTGAAATESQFKKVQKVIKSYQDKLNQAEEQYLRQKYELNRDYNEDVRKLREKEAEDQEKLLKQSAKRLTDIFANASKRSLGDLFSSETVTQLETKINKLSDRLTISVAKEVSKTTNTTVGELIQSLADRIVAARNLIRAATDLAAKGFTQTFIEQVVETGTETGTALADAILTASPEQQEALRRNFLELETVTETGMDGVAKSLTDKFKLATRELNAQSDELAKELDDSLKERALTLKNALEDAAWSFSGVIAVMRKEFTDAIGEFDKKLAGLDSTVEALFAKMTKIGMTDIQKNLTGPEGALAGATVADVKVVKNAVNAAGIVIDSAADVASTAAYVAARIAAANTYIKSSSSNAAQEAVAKAQIQSWTNQLTELQTAAKQGQDVSQTVININVKTSSDQSVAMVGKTLGSVVTKYVTTGGQVLVSGTK